VIFQGRPPLKDNEELNKKGGETHGTVSQRSNSMALIHVRSRKWKRGAEKEIGQRLLSAMTDLMSKKGRGCENARFPVTKITRVVERGGRGKI